MEIKQSKDDDGIKPECYNTEKPNANTLPKTVFVAHVHDRHIDPETMVFLNRERAIQSVIKYMREHVAHPEYLVEEDDGQEFEIRYGLEPDYGYVIECEIE